MPLEPFKTFRSGSNQAFVLREDDGLLLVKAYLGANAAEHRTCEQQKTACWLEHGFPVPRVLGREVSELSGRTYLVMEFLAGITLQEWLRDPGVKDHEKQKVLEQVLRSNERRHHLALDLEEHDLVHHDLNTSNLLVSPPRFYYLDFEARVPGTASLEEVIALETAKFSRWVVRDWGRRHLETFVDLLATVYADLRPIMEIIVHRTRSRPFQWYHRWRDARRKESDRGEITKYDIADAINSRLK